MTVKDILDRYQKNYENAVSYIEEEDGEITFEIPCECCGEPQEISVEMIDGVVWVERGGHQERLENWREFLKENACYL